THRRASPGLSGRRRVHAILPDFCGFPQHLHALCTKRNAAEKSGQTSCQEEVLPLDRSLLTGVCPIRVLRLRRTEDALDTLMKLALISLCHRSESSVISLLRARLWSKAFTAAISSLSSSKYCVLSTPSNVLLSAFTPM